MVIGPLGPIFAFLVIVAIVVGALIVRLARGEGLPPFRRRNRDRPPSLRDHLR